jgi:hypothetical protein
MLVVLIHCGRRQLRMIFAGARSSHHRGWCNSQRSETSLKPLLGQAIPFATPGNADVWGGFGGLGLEWRTRNVTFFSTSGSEASRARASSPAGPSRR